MVLEEENNSGPAGTGLGNPSENSCCIIAYVKSIRDSEFDVGLLLPFLGLPELCSSEPNLPELISCSS